MNDIQIFNNEEFGAVRTTGTPEQPLFCLADVAFQKDKTVPGTGIDLAPTSAAPVYNRIHAPSASDAV